MHASRRAIILVSICAAAGAGRAGAADSSGGDYLPLTQGAKWHYNAKVNGQAGTMTIRVASVQVVAGRQAAQLETVVNGRVTATETLGTSAEGVFRLSMNGNDLTPPLQVLRYPVSKGDSWSGQSRVANQSFQANSVVDVQQVSVPAGTFEAAVVTTRAETPEGTIRNKLWFAPGIGLIKQDVQLSGISITAELTRYEPAH